MNKTLHFYVSIYCIINTIFVTFLFSGAFCLLLKLVKPKYIRRLGPGCVLFLFFLFALRSVIWIDGDRHFKGLFDKKFLPVLYTFLRDYSYKGITPLLVLFTIWAAGAAILMARKCIRYVQDQRRLRCLERDLPLEALVSEICADYKVHKKVRALRGENIISPFVTGIRRPVIIFPADIPPGDEKELYQIICHEIIHIRHHDLLLLFLMDFISCLYWWNPFMGFLKKKIKMYIEMRTDETALKHSSDTARLAYCETLLRFARKSNPANISLSAPFYVPGVLENRLQSILKPAKQSVIAKGLAAGLGILIFTFTIMYISVPEYPDPDDGSFCLTEENSKVIEKDGYYEVYYNGELLFKTKDEQYLP